MRTLRRSPAMGRWVLIAALALGATGAHALFYDPFPDAASVHPTDELEERIWHEAEVFRQQFTRGQTPERLGPVQRSVRAVLARNWPALAGKLDLTVIDNADVVAVSSANGDIVISTGMLMRLDTEEELVAVLAREVAHVVQRHAVRTVYAARLGAGANVVFQTVVKANSLVGTVGLISAFQVTPEMLLVDGGKAFIQNQLGRIKDTMADNFVRRMSATGFDAMVKTSLFGYSEALEAEADAYSLGVLAQRYGGTDAFRRVMQRLLDEARDDEKKFSAFYASEPRLVERLKAAEQRAVSGSPEGVSHPGGPALEPTASPMAAAATAVALPEGVMELPSLGGVAAVVVGDDQADLQAAPSGALRSAAFVSSAAEAEAQPYGALLVTWSLPVFEAELEAGRIGRLMRNIERPRLGVTLPASARVVLAEACLAHRDTARQERAPALLREHLQQHPDDARALRLMGQIALRKGDLEEARGQFSKAREHATSDEERGFIDQYLEQMNRRPGGAS